MCHTRCIVVHLILVPTFFQTTLTHGLPFLIRLIFFSNAIAAAVAVVVVVIGFFLFPFASIFVPVYVRYCLLKRSKCNYLTVCHIHSHLPLIVPKLMHCVQMCQLDKWSKETVKQIYEKKKSFVFHSDSLSLCLLVCLFLSSTTSLALFLCVYVCERVCVCLVFILRFDRCALMRYNSCH